MKLCVRVCLIATALGAVCLEGQDAALKTASREDCSFQARPEEFLSRQLRNRRDIFDSTVKVGRSLSRNAVRGPAEPAPIRNLIDEEIFGKLARSNVAPARLTTDEEFLRRIYLDLTGGLPAPQQIREFVASENASKRDDVIESLLGSKAFVDKWAMWWGDILLNVAFPQNFDRQYNGRNIFDAWIKQSLTQEKGIREIAWEAVTAAGNSFDLPAAATNWALNAKTPMGPIQDTYDTMLNRTASAFLGLSHYDCLLCHNGRGRLEQISLWGSTATRVEAQKMAAFFARLEMPQRNLPITDFYYRSFDVRDRTTGNYDLNTNFGNRPDRVAIANQRFFTPEYRVTGATPPAGNWRTAFADNMVNDPMFAVNFANRLWKEFFILPLVDPVDGLDPARLDPSNPPPAPWVLQATHPELLARLAQALADSDYNLRAFIRTIAQSSAYQLSSRYEGEWKYDYVSLFARHYPRRLEGEEVHDILSVATGQMGSYTVNNLTARVALAVQLPEPIEPRSNGAVRDFMNTFIRGNRDTFYRSQNGSILQQLALMNDAFVNNRLRVASSPPLAAIAKMADDAAVDEIFLLLVARKPSDSERQNALEFLKTARTGAERNEFIEDLAWVCVNKVEFIFSY
ncbi:MAG: DUF1553 domain-containing protein [Bryobacteraceae bacterium]